MFVRFVCLVGETCLGFWHPYVGVDISSYPIISAFYEIVAAHDRISTSPATSV